MTRFFKARLPNGLLVTLPNILEADAEPAQQLADLVNSTDVTERALVDFISNTGNAIFSTADPKQELKYQPGMSERGFDWTFPIVGSNDLGIVEIGPAQSISSDAIERTLGRVHDYALTLAGRSEVRVQETHFIVGRRGAISWPTVPEAVPFKVNFLTWDDVVDRLSGKPETEEEKRFAVVVENILTSSRKLLSLIADRQELLDGIEDREFEKLTATLVSDLGFAEVELTPRSGDGGKDVVAVYLDPVSGKKFVVLIECKHWVMGGKVHLKIATRLAQVVKKDDAGAGILLASGGFGPKLIEQEAKLEKKKNVHLRGRQQLLEWIEVWERQYGSPIYVPSNALDVLGLKMK